MPPHFVFEMTYVSKSYGDKEVLRDISLSFFPGAKIGVLGLNGSGKSTLLRIMAGIDTDILGEARPQAGIKIGYLPQEPKLNPDKNVRGNVEEGLQEAVDFQWKIARHDGVEKVTEEGTVLFSDKAKQAVESIDPHLCEPLTLDECLSRWRLLMSYINS